MKVVFKDQDLIAEFTPYDVVFGRGKFLINTSGNIRMRNIVDKERKRYASSSRSEKGKIIDEVLGRISESPEKNNPVRFLLPASVKGKYKEASWDEARAKISHRLREDTAEVKQAKRLKKKQDDMTMNLLSTPPLYLQPRPSDENDSTGSSVPGKWNSHTQESAWVGKNDAGGEMDLLTGNDNSEAFLLEMDHRHPSFEDDLSGCCVPEQWTSYAEESTQIGKNDVDNEVALAAAASSDSLEAILLEENHVRKSESQDSENFASV